LIRYVPIHLFVWGLFVIGLPFYKVIFGIKILVIYFAMIVLGLHRINITNSNLKLIRTKIGRNPISHESQ